MKQKSFFQKERPKPVGSIIVVTIATLIACAVGLVFKFYEPPVPGQPVTLEQLQSLLQDLELKETPSKPDPLLVSLGKAMFHDEQLLLHGESCASCHTQGKSPTITTPTFARNANPMHRPITDYPFFWDGRALTLKAAILGHVEEAGPWQTARSDLARAIANRYGDKLDNLSSPLIKSVMHSASPRKAPLPLTVPVASFGLSSVGNYDLIRLLLESSTGTGRAPANLFQELMSAVHQPPVRWSQAWQQLSEPAQKEIHAVFDFFGDALSAYVMSQENPRTPFDDFAAAMQTTEAPELAFRQGFGADEFAGLQIFAGKGNCISCHNGPAFSDGQFYHMSVTKGTARPDAGRAMGIYLGLTNSWNCHKRGLPSAEAQKLCDSEVSFYSEDTSLLGAFKTPSLRNLTYSAPYFHDGSAATLFDVLHTKQNPANPPSIGKRWHEPIPVLSDAEQTQLVAFLKSLSKPGNKEKLALP